MKSFWLYVCAGYVSWGLAMAGRAATNDTAAALQQALFEEEVNHNLPVAIEAYQGLITRLDQQRKLTATAIYHLGECYRKQGNTNLAVAEYERVLRDFADQTALVGFSRQNLQMLGRAPAKGATEGAQTSALGTAAQKLAALKLLPADQVPTFVAREFPDPTLSRLLVQRAEAEQKLAVLQKDFGPEHPEVKSQETLLKTIAQQIEGVVSGIVGGLTALVQNQGAIRPTTETVTLRESDEVRRIQSLIQNSPDLINAPDKNGETLLETAAAKGNMEVARVLIEEGAKVSGTRQPGLTPLHYAAANGHKAMVDLLLGKGATVDAKTDSGVTPLHLASLKGYEAVVKSLLAGGANPKEKVTGDVNRNSEDISYNLIAGEMPLHIAARSGYAGVVEQLIASGADVNAEGGGGRTALSYAAAGQSESVIKALLAAGANPNAGKRELPLAVAAIRGGDITPWIAAGAEVNLRSLVNNDVSTRQARYDPATPFSPLFLAVAFRHPDTISALIRAKADPNELGPAGSPLLFDALGDAGILKALLEGGADVNKADRDGQTPLLFAVNLGTSAEIIDLLLTHGANADARGSDGNTALHVAALRGDTSTVEELLKKGVKVDSTNDFGSTPLHVAVERGNSAVVALLLKGGANPNAQDKAGRSPLDLTKRQGLMPGGIPMATAVPHPASPLRVTRGGTPPAPAKPMADVLREYGAVDELPRMDRIQVKRSSTAYINSVFVKPTNDWNQFTVLEVLAVSYGFLTSDPSPSAAYRNDTQPMSLLQASPLRFPDLGSVKVRRPEADLKSWKTIQVDLTSVINNGDCTKDVVLSWGDVVEVPEQDHPVNLLWGGFTTPEFENLKKCLSRQVELRNGRETVKRDVVPDITIPKPRPVPAPGEQLLDLGGGPVRIKTNARFWLGQVLQDSNLVLTSSDLSRVKVTRLPGPAGQGGEWTIDCSAQAPAPALWVRDGDIIEIPERR